MDDSNSIQKFKIKWSNKTFMIVRRVENRQVSLNLNNLWKPINRLLMALLISLLTSIKINPEEHHQVRINRRNRKSWATNFLKDTWMIWYQIIRELEVIIHWVSAKLLKWCKILVHSRDILKKWAWEKRKVHFSME